MVELHRIEGPFPLATAHPVFTPDALARLDRLFTGDQAWVRHQDHFYRCHIAEVDGQLPEELLDATRRRVASALGLDLLPIVRVTAQRMDPSDGADPHTDRPLAGYEAARLVVQLDSGEEGRFQTFGPEGQWLDLAPRPGLGVAFELSTASHHAVTPCTTARRTVVFHFWHAANPPDARQAIDALLGSMTFADLPAALDPAMLEAEAVHDEERCRRAALAAWLLHRWGNDDEQVVAGYRRLVAGAALRPEEALARWLVGLHLDHFDRHAWDQLEPTPHWPPRGV